MPLLLKDIQKRYGEKEVLHNFSMIVEEGERACIFGPSGGGKTTLLQIIAGLVSPDSGEVRRPEGNISYIFQEYRLLPWLTAEENITATTGCSKERAREILTALELGKERKGYPDEFSGGMKQRLNIARALAFPSTLILLDEPFKGLDPELREKVIAYVDQCCQDRTVVLVTHDRTESEQMKCTKIYEM